MPLLYASSASVLSQSPAAQSLQVCEASQLDFAIQLAVEAALQEGIGALERTIAGILLWEGRAGEHYTLPSIIGALSRPDNLELLLHHLLADEQALSAIQRNSYYHHNGFRKLVLLQSAVFKLRLHLWEARNEAHHENIHDHRWNFASTLLAGSFTTVIWEEDPNGPEVRLNCTYTPAKEGQTYGVRENGLVQLRQQATHTLRAGDMYYMPASTLHQVTDPGQGHTRSLMLTATPVLDGCKLYADHPIAEADKENVPFTRTAIRRELVALLYTHCAPAAMAA